MTVSVFVTGTDGKTTTLACLAKILISAGWNTAQIGSQGIHVNGKKLPISPSDWYPEAETLAYEIGKIGLLLPPKTNSAVLVEVTSFWLKLGLLNFMVPDIAAITSLGHDHLDLHGTLQSYHREKSKILDATPYAVLGPNVSARLQEIEAISHNCQIVNVARQKGIVLNTNLAIATQIARYLGVRNHRVDLPKLAGRQEWFQRNNSPHVVVDSAHTSDSIAAALSDIRRNVPREGRLIALVGAGGNRDSSKRSAMGRAVVAKADITIITDDVPRFENPCVIRDDVAVDAPEALIIEGRAAAVEAALCIAQTEDVIALLGLGSQTFTPEALYIGDRSYLKKLGFKSQLNFQEKPKFIKTSQTNIPNKVTSEKLNRLEKMET